VSPTTGRSVPPGTASTTVSPSTGTPSTGAPSTGAPSTTSPGVTVTAAAGARSLTVAAGQVLTVTLATGDLWAEPVSSKPDVLRRITGRVDRATGDATGRFTAAAPGSARISSSHRCLPVAGQVCGQYIALWYVTVTVT
jgi:hypothetical protein